MTTKTETIIIAESMHVSVTGEFWPREPTYLTFSFDDSDDARVSIAYKNITNAQAWRIAETINAMLKEVDKQ